MEHRLDLGHLRLRLGFGQRFRFKASAALRHRGNTLQGSDVAFTDLNAQRDLLPGQLLLIQVDARLCGIVGHQHITGVNGLTLCHLDLTDGLRR